MRGSASVEQVGLAALIAVLLLAAIAAIASGGDVDAGRTLAGAIGRKISCAPRLPDPCRRHPLVPTHHGINGFVRKAYGIVRVSRRAGREGESFVSPTDQR